MGSKVNPLPSVMNSVEIPIFCFLIAFLKNAMLNLVTDFLSFETEGQFRICMCFHPQKTISIRKNPSMNSQL